MKGGRILAVVQHTGAGLGDQWACGARILHDRSDRRALTVARLSVDFPSVGGFTLLTEGRQPMATIPPDTIPSPAPEPVEFTTIQIEVARAEAHQAPRYVERITAELRAILTGIRCSEHVTAPAVTVTFGPDDDAVVCIVPHDCCRHLDDLVEEALKDSPVFRVVRPT